jgi:RHS repeat-associated protein
MLPAAEEEMLSPLAPSSAWAEERGGFSFAAGVGLAALETHQSENRARGKKTHQEIFSRNCRLHVSAMWAKWSGTHQDSGWWWSKTVLGIVIDANGNTLSDASGKSYTWDFENRLTQVVKPGVGTTTFRYDPFGRRIQKSGPLGTTNYLYDGQWENVIERWTILETSLRDVARYNQEMGLDFPLSEFRSGAASYYEQDGVNSVTSLSSSAGALANTYTFDSFGKLITSTGTVNNPFQYTAREFDPETGIYEYRARYYDPSVGRFISEDPVGFAGGHNLYDYVSGDPVDFDDPSGNRRIHGNWCGPNWTCGQTEPYIPSHDQDGYYKDPRDYVDKVCSHHDKCYAKCRAKHPCSAWGRRIYNRKCDFFLIGRIVANPLDIFDPWAYVIGLGIGLDFIPPAGPNGGPEPDKPVSCPSCK